LKITPEQRRWIYGILLALAPIAVVYDIATTQQVNLWVGLAAAALGIAMNNVPK
jgi:hypothetical protein